VGPLKVLAAANSSSSNAASQRFLIVTDRNDPSNVVLQQTSASNGQYSSGELARISENQDAKTCSK